MNTSTGSHDVLALIQEKQKAHALCSATESRLCRCYAEAARHLSFGSDNLLQLLENHFLNIASQPRFAYTRPRAHQTASYLLSCHHNQSPGISPPRTSVRPFA